MGAPQAISDHLPNKYRSERTLRRCTSRKKDNIVLIDVDSDDFGDVIILDVPESFRKKFRKIPKNVISIDDDDDGCESSDEDLPRNNDASATNKCCSTEAVHPSTSACADDDSLFDNEGNTPVKLPKSKRTYSEFESNSRNRYGLNPDSEGSSESDYSDCELIEGSSGKLREQWEKASYRKRNDYNGFPPDFDNEAGTSAPSHKFHGNSDEGTTEDAHPLDEQNNLKNCSMHSGDAQFAQSPQGFSEVIEDPMEMNVEFTSTPSHPVAVGGDDFEEVTKCPCKDGENDQESDDILALIPEPKLSCVHENESVSCPDPNSLITDRQKIKETEEYKHALEEEMAARQQQLLQQAEEARRLRNRKKAENMRIMMNEKRQKERLEEIRQTRIRDEENLNMKEKYRAEIRKELHRIETVCYDMASLLRCLGIHVTGSPCPSQNDVQVAYKRACLKFHPDRISACDLRQQVEAEEKFKLISNMKDKFLFK